MATPETVTEPYWMGDMTGAISLRDKFALRLTENYSFMSDDPPQETNDTIKLIFDIADRLAAEAVRRRKT